MCIPSICIFRRSRILHQISVFHLIQPPLCDQIAKIYNIELTPLEDCSPEQKQIRKNIGKSINLSRKKIFYYLWMNIKPDIKPTILGGYFKPFAKTFLFPQ